MGRIKGRSSGYHSTRDRRTTNTDKPFTFRLARREKVAVIGAGLPRTGDLKVTILFFLTTWRAGPVGYGHRMVV